MFFKINCILTDFNGGSWYDPAKFCTVFKRRFTREENAFDHVRFSIARTIVE